MTTTATESHSRPASRRALTESAASDRLAAAPLGAVVLGGGLSAWPIARQRTRSRRAGSFVVAFLLAGLAAFSVLAGAATGSPAVILGGHVLTGAATAR